MASTFSRDSLIARIMDKSEAAREALDDFRRTENESSDEGNEDAIYAATAALDAFDAAISNLVP